MMKNYSHYVKEVKKNRLPNVSIVIAVYNFISLFMWLYKEKVLKDIFKIVTSRYLMLIVYQIIFFFFFCSGFCYTLVEDILL